MHAEVMDFLRQTFTANPSRMGVLEIGSRNINGSARDVIAATCETCDGHGRITGDDGDAWDCAHAYHGVDIAPGPGVDEIADGVTVEPPFAIDVVICCEVFEHTRDWPGIVSNAFNILQPGGRLVVTMATTGRAPHSAVDGGGVREGEFYENVTREQLEMVATSCGFTIEDIHSHTNRGDLYAVLRKSGVTPAVVDHL